MARSFSAGSSQYLETSTFASAATLPVTVAAWLRPDSTSGFQRAVSWTTGAGSVCAASLLLNYPGAGQLSNQVLGGAANVLPTASGTFSAGAWCHAAVVTDATAARAYLNGAAGSDATYSSATLTSTTYLSVGRIISTQYYSGRVAELGIWSVALSAAEVGALADGYTPLEIRPDSLIAYYPLGGQYGQYDLDRWKNKYDLTPANSPTWAEHSRVIYPAYGGTWAVGPAPAAPQAYELICDPASVSVSGQSVSLLVNRTLTASPAQVAVSGQSATLTTSRVLTANPASVGVTGQSAGLRADRTLSASPAAVQVAGQSATLTVNRVLTCQPATVQVSGQQATLYKGLAPLVGDAAQVAVSGQAATLRVNRLLVCVGAAIQVAGQLATLTYSGDQSDGVDLTPDAETVAHARTRPAVARAQKRATIAGANKRATVARAR